MTTQLKLLNIKNSNGRAGCGIPKESINLIPIQKKECLKLKRSMCKFKDGKTKKCDCHRLKAQPGYDAGYKRIKKSKNYTCKNLTKRILADNNGIYKTKGENDVRVIYNKGFNF